MPSLKYLFQIVLIFLLINTNIWAISLGDSRTDIDNSTSVNADIFSYRNIPVALSEKLFVDYINYNDYSIVRKLIDTDGVLSDMPSLNLSPTTNDGVDWIYFMELSNGNTLVYWYGTSVNNGMDDIYFKIIDSIGDEVLGATKINSLSNDLNRFTQVTQLSNGNLAFVWEVDDGTNAIALRRFQIDGTPLDTNQIMIRDFSGMDSSKNMSSFYIAGNSSGKFMILFDTYTNYIRGMIFDNDSNSPELISGNSDFVVTDKNEGSTSIPYVKALSNGNFLTTYQKTTTGNTSDRYIFFKIYSPDGSVVASETSVQQLYSNGRINQPVIYDTGFVLTYFSWNGSSNITSGLKSYNNDGSLESDLTSSLPSITNQYGTVVAFKDVDDKVSLIVNDTDGNSDLDLWVLRNYPIDLLSSDSDANLIAGITVDESSIISISSTSDTESEKVDIFDFTISDGGTSDRLPTDISQIVVHTSGTADFSKVTWLLNGDDATNIEGVYSSSSNTITFSGLSISIADGDNETYIVSGYFNNNTGLIDNSTFGLSIDGDSDITVNSSNSRFGTTSVISNSLNAKVDITATKLIFNTIPSR